MSTARASSSECSTTGSRFPSGISISVSFQVCTTRKDRLVRFMTLAVDALELGQIGTNCYLVRRDPSAAEAVVDVFRRPEDFFPGIPMRAYEGDATLLAGGETVEAAGVSFQVRHVPGHSPGHRAYYAEGCLFSG